jgi:hypothetical protein
MVQAIGWFVGWVLKNTALVLGIVEALCKLITGIVVATPTKRDDTIILPKVDAFFSFVKKVLYDRSESVTGGGQ